jgi:GntR family transcriptional regulator
MCLKHVRHADGQPLDLNDSYYPYDLVAGTEVLTPADIPRGVGNVLRELGHEQGRFVDEITARTVGDDEHRRLDLPAGVPVIEHVRTGYTAERQGRTTVTVVPGNRVRLLYEVDA